MSIRRTALSFIIGLLAIFRVTGACASPPSIVGPIHDEGTVPLADCGTFQVLDNFSLDFSLYFFSDNAGNLIKILEQVAGTDTFINSVTAKSYTARFHNTVKIDPKLDVGATTGVISHLTVPGMGAVLLDVGRLVADPRGIIFEAGPHQLFDGEVAGLCAALE